MLCTHSHTTPRRAVYSQPAPSVPYVCGRKLGGTQTKTNRIQSKNNLSINIIYTLFVILLHVVFYCYVMGGRYSSSKTNHHICGF